MILNYIKQKGNKRVSKQIEYKNGLVFIRAKIRLLGCKK
jgi:hypothetical protein